MKESQEAAEEYENKELYIEDGQYTSTAVIEAFKAGVAYALKWIKFEDELPITGNRILFKENYGEEQVILLTQKQEDIVSILKGFTYWRYLQVF